MSSEGDTGGGALNPPSNQFSQKHEELVLSETWWWAVHLTLCSVAVVGNLLFIVTIIFNRKQRDLKTFATAVIVTLAFLDVLDVARVLPVLVKSLFDNDVFRTVYCTLGVFHEMAVALFLVSLGVAVCVASGTKETKYYTGGADPRASLAQKILIPVILLVSAGVAAPLFLLSYNKLGHSCTDPFRAEHIVKTDSETFLSDLYSTGVSAVTYALPVLILPLALPIACLKTCISRQCCVPRFKQPIGEVVMTCAVGIVYLGTVVGVILPRLGEVFKGSIGEELEPMKVVETPLLWELGNNAARPLIYFMTNPGVWDGLGSLCSACCCCCSSSKNRLAINGDHEEESEMNPLAPVTSV